MGCLAHIGLVFCRICPLCGASPVADRNSIWGDGVLPCGVWHDRDVSATSPENGHRGERHRRSRSQAADSDREFESDRAGDTPDDRHGPWDGDERTSSWGGDERTGPWGRDERTSSWRGDERTFSWGGDERTGPWGGDERTSSWGGDERTGPWGGDERTSSWRGDERPGSWRGGDGGQDPRDGDEIRDDRDDEIRGDGRDDDTAPPEPPAPVRRLLHLAIALFSLIAAGSLALGAQSIHSADAVVVFGMQVLFVIIWTLASQPPAPRVVVAVGLAVALATDIAAVLTRTPSLEPLAYLTAAGFVAAVVGQLARRAGRIRATESLGSSLVVMVGVVAFGALIELTRHTRGRQALVVCIAAAGLAVAVARLSDIVLPLPRIVPQVPRGGLGVVLGTMVGTGAAAVTGYYLQGLGDPTRAALAGLATALVATMVDLSVGYTEAGRKLDGRIPVLWVARHLQGPLGALAFAAPVGYVASVLLLNVG